MARAEFTAIAGLDELVARMVAPEVEDIAERYVDKAKEFAPPTKVWRTQPAGVCEHCKPLDGVELPENQRFEAVSFEWDMQHRGLGPITFLLFPRDPSSGAEVFVSHCKCYIEPRPGGMAETIGREETIVHGATVTCLVYSAHEKMDVVSAEFGTVYDSGKHVSEPTHFLANAAAQFAAEGRAGR